MGELEHNNYTMIRQPYRITMANWEFSVIQKRILTTIVASLQKEINQVSKGVSASQLDLFNNPNSTPDTVSISFPLITIVKNSNNYAAVKAALKQLRSKDVEITLPPVKGKGDKPKESTTILTGLIERAEVTKHSRIITVVIHKATALELVKTMNGLTSFAQEVMFRTDNKNLQRLYEIISHWKDQKNISMTPEIFRERMGLEGKYNRERDLVNVVIKPIERELQEMIDMDIYFVFRLLQDKSGKHTKYVFDIYHRKQLKIDQEKAQVDIDYNKHLMRTHFKFSSDDFKSIDSILSNQDYVYKLREKLMDIEARVNDKGKAPIANIVKYAIVAIKDAFPE